MMVRTVSLLPLVAAMLSVFLAGFALATTGARNRTTRYFLLLNAGTAMWCFAHFVQLNIPGVVDVVLAQPGTDLHLLLVVQALGVALAPTYGFLFGAAYAHKDEWLRVPRVLVAYAPLVYTFAVAVTNPWHHLFIVSADATGSYAYGPLAPLHQISGTLLGAAGFWFIVSSSWRRGTRSGRRQAIVIGSAALVPMIGGIVWMLRHRLGLPLTVNLSPELAPVSAFALGYELFRSGLADIAPHAALQTFDALTDGAISLDDDGEVVAINRMARRLFPGVRMGERLETNAPELASAAGACLGHETGYTGFDLELGGLLYWVRVRRTSDRRGQPFGCVILLSDVTEMRATQARIVELTRALDENLLDRARSTRLVERRSVGE